MPFTFLKTLLLSILILSSLSAKRACVLPTGLQKIAKPLTRESWRRYPDLRRNLNSLKGLCIYKVAFKEGRFAWEMLLLFNPNHPKGAFWFLPHDNENSAFDAALYAIKRYKGGFLSVVAGNRRLFHSQDPNRNFGTTKRSARVCSGQRAPAPIYTRTIFYIIDHFRQGAPYLALHNNADGYRGDGGRGTISILHSTPRSQAYPAWKSIERSNGGLRDEDTMVYIAGTSFNAPKSKIARLNRLGINVKYEWVDALHNDCSMSNYVILGKRTQNYYNIETQEGDSKTQKKIIDLLFRAGIIP